MWISEKVLRKNKGSPLAVQSRGPRRQGYVLLSLSPPGVAGDQTAFPEYMMNVAGLKEGKGTSLSMKESMCTEA